MAYGRFNPLDDTNTYPFMNGRNPGASGNSYKTFAQLLEDINAKGFNTAIVRPSKSGDGNLAYYTIIAFNIPDSDIFRIGNDEYFTGSYYPNGIYFENFGDVSGPNVGGYYYANGSLVDTGVSYTLYTRCSATQSKDNISYHGVSGDDNNCLDLGCVIVSNANVGTWYFNNAPLVAYQWSTVSSVTGKNGKYTLTKILNINDGEPVDNITNKGNLDFSKKTKVNTLVTDSFVPEHKEDATKALAKYEVQNKVYSYCTLVYKKGEIPSDVTDGTAIQIDPDGDEVAITGLEENKTYYFVIFTNKTTSEPYRFRTGKNEAPEGIFKIRITTTQGVKDSGFKEVIEVARQ